MPPRPTKNSAAATSIESGIRRERASKEPCGELHAGAYCTRTSHGTLSKTVRAN